MTDIPESQASTSPSGALTAQTSPTANLSLETATSAGQPQGVAPGPPAPSTANTTSGTVQAFRDIRRELTPEELTHPGVQKLILNSLDNALALNEKLSSYEVRFHEKDKQVDVLQERLKPQTALDLAFTAGLAIGLAFVGFATVAWDGTPKWVGPVFLVSGLLLTAGAIALKWILLR